MKTIEKSYNDLVLSNPTWVGPVFRKVNSLVLCKSYFYVDLVDFEEISSIPSVRIVYMRRKYTLDSNHQFSVCFELF